MVEASTGANGDILKDLTTQNSQEFSPDVASPGTLSTGTPGAAVLPYDPIPGFLEGAHWNDRMLADRHDVETALHEVLVASLMPGLLGYQVMFLARAW